MAERMHLTAFEEEFRKSKRYVDDAVAQVAEPVLHQRINPQQNSIAVVMQHVAGNLISRFTDFLTTDGEKPTRDRESEFGERQLSRAQLTELWERAWSVLLKTLSSLRDEDLDKVVFIRHEPHTVLKALVRSSAHCAWHAAQVALIAKHFSGERWHYLTIPPKGSEEFNAKMASSQDGAKK